MKACVFSGMISFIILTSGCGSNGSSESNTDQSNSQPSLSNPTVGESGQDGVVVKSRAILPLDLAPSSPLTALLKSSYLSATQPINVINAVTSSMVLDNSLFLIPTISNAVLNFGYLQITGLKDNNLWVCGTNGKQKCNTALIRMYTTGTVLAGLYNSADNYGAPILAGKSPLSTVGLNTAGAITLQSFTIPSSKNVLNLSDFQNPKYNVQVDMTNAGAGTYTTTLVLEYALSP